MNEKSNLGIFIDEANIYHSQKTLGWDIGYLNLIKYFETFGKIEVLNLYMSYQKENYRQKTFIKKLKKYGYKVFCKKLKLIKNDNAIIRKGNLDTELTLDAYINKDKYDTLILFSGDSDFEYLLKLLKKENKKIIVCSTGGHISRELINLSDKYIDLKKLKEHIDLQNQQTPQINLEGS